MKPENSNQKKYGFTPLEVRPIPRRYYSIARIRLAAFICRKTTSSKRLLTGFTLLETLVAISILVTAIVGPLTLAATTIRSQQVAKDNLVAANLAQEGVELIRNYRSNNVLRWRIQRDFYGSSEIPIDHWMDGMDNCFNASGCGVDVWYVDNSALPSCSNVLLNNCALYFDSLLNLDTHAPCAGCEQTKFQRSVRIEDIVPGQEVRVRVVVSWSGILGDRSLEVTTHLLNWDDKP